MVKRESQRHNERERGRGRLTWVSGGEVGPTSQSGEEKRKRRKSERLSTTSQLCPPLDS